MRVSEAPAVSKPHDTTPLKNRLDLSDAGCESIRDKSPGNLSRLLYLFSFLS